MATCPVTIHEAEQVSDCRAAILAHREAVREVNSRFSPLRLDYERECYAYLNTFSDSVIAEAEGVIWRMSR